jgi:hypothetical protein
MFNWKEHICTVANFGYSFVFLLLKTFKIFDFPIFWLSADPMWRLFQISIRLIFNSYISDGDFFLKVHAHYRTNCFFSGDFQGQEGVRIMYIPVFDWFGFMVFNATFNNISVISLYFHHRYLSHVEIKLKK